MYRVSKKQEQIFWKWIDEYAAKLRVADWTIVKKVEDEHTDDPGALATCASNPDFKTSEITLYRKWGDVEPTADNLRETAFHEILHIVTASLMSLAETRHVTEKQLDDAEHDVIRSFISYAFDRRSKTA